MQARAVQVFLTTADGARLFEPMPNWHWMREKDLQHDEDRDEAEHAEEARLVKLFLDPEVQFQTIEGFGATLTDSSAFLMSRMAPIERRALLIRLFGPRSRGGIQLNLLRLPIGATDNSVSYQMGKITYDDVDRDFGLHNFSTSADDAYYIPLLREILEVSPEVHFIASPWTAPLWLKTSSIGLGEGTLRGGSAVMSTYAEYLVRYLQDYKSKGIAVSFLTLQNEPGHGGCGPMPCMTLWPDQETDLATQVARRLNSSNVSGVRLLAYDHNWAPTVLEAVVQRSIWVLVALLAACTSWLVLMCIFRLCCRVHEETEDPPLLLAHLSLNREDGMLSRTDSGWGMRRSNSNSTRPVCYILLMSVWCCCLGAGLCFFAGVFPSAFPVQLSGMPIGPAYPGEVLTSAAGPLFAGVAWHCYGGSASAMGELDKRLHQYFGDDMPSVEHHITECTHVGGTFSYDLQWNQRELFIGGVNHGARSVMHWSLALDQHFGPHCDGGSCCTTCRGVVTVPRNTHVADDVVYNVEFWGLAHHSALVDRGSRRIFVKVAVATDVDATAYRTPYGEVVLVVANSKHKGDVTLDIRCNGYGFRFPLPPGVVTFVWSSWD